MLMQALDFFVWKVPSIWLDIDKLQDHQFWPVELSMATRMRRFCGGLSHRHPGGTASRFLQVPARVPCFPGTAQASHG